MSYQLVAAKARSKGLDAIWSDVDISAMKISALFANYTSVWMTLSHPALTKNVYLKLDDVREQVSSKYHNLTIPQWLTAIGDLALPTNVALPDLTLRKVRCTDVWRAGYDVKPFDRTRHPDAQIPYGEKDDLLLSKEGVDFRIYHRFSLVSVNGFFHRTGASEHGLQVVDGGRTGRLGNDNQVSLHSFYGVGALDFIPITADMIYKTTADGKLADRAYVELPYNVEDKTVLLVIGGYLHVLDEVYTRIGPRSLRINMNQLALAERYFESWKLLDLTSLPLTLNKDNPGHISPEELYSDEVIKAYLSVSQSFVIVVNTKDFYVRRHPVVNSQIPGRYEVPAGTERLPLFGPWGKVCDYAIFPDWGVNVLACSENMRKRYMFRTTDWRGRRTIDDSQYAYRPWDWANGHLLEMGRVA
ncbi:hypothetical protein [Xanthomonas phage RTH11]|nr:hypothetical protein [Xanthomonas phage RTH11]